MQAYTRNFARVYNVKWSNYAKQVAPLILNFYRSTPIGQTNKSLLDLCCGTGNLALHFLENGFTVVGIDLSEHMLHYAKENTSRYCESGQATFIQADASNFTLSEHFGLVVSTYDSLNHLDGVEALRNCFRCVYAVCDGYFIFDLNTRTGLKRWNSIQVDESSEDAFVVTRGFYDGESDRAWTKITGFVKAPDDSYERFEETVFNAVYEMEGVKEALLEVGWSDVFFARIQSLSTPLDEPEKEPRVFVVVRK